MILTGVCEYLREHGRASLADLARHFDSDPSALEGMLARLEHQGRVRRLPLGERCGSSCCQCEPTSLAVYEWTA